MDQVPISEDQTNFPQGVREFVFSIVLGTFVFGCKHSPTNLLIQSIIGVLQAGSGERRNILNQSGKMVKETMIRKILEIVNDILLSCLWVLRVE